MPTIYKYPLETLHEQQVTMPFGDGPVSVDVQDERICVWALVDPVLRGLRTVVFRIYGTGRPVPRKPGCFLGTVQLHGCVWHVFFEER